MNKTFRNIFTLVLTTGSVHAYALNFDGSGHYSLRGETLVNPGMAADRGLYQVIKQDFRLTGEARLNDKSSFFMEMKLFDDDRKSYLGDTTNPESCSDTRHDPNANCEGKYQDTNQPGYKPYTPRVSKAYARFGFEYCLVEAGRRGRDWGLGILHDSGEDPFETSASIYDGVTCDVNIHRSQTLGFSVGYDKLAETGSDIAEETKNTYGASAPSDDLDQFFLTIEYDNRKTANASSFARKIGMYASAISGPSSNNNGSDTDIKFLDLYTAFYLGNITFKNEFLFRTGKTSDPNYWALGGALDKDGSIASNDVNAAAIAGSLEWILSSNMTNIQNDDDTLGKGYSHGLFLEYAFAPGSSQGYYNELNRDGKALDKNVELEKNADVFNRGSKAEAFSFHRNYKPALILFNSPKEVDDLKVDGAFDPSRLVNASVFTFGYKYQEINGNNFEAKLISAQMSEGLPSGVRSYYEANTSLSRPAGFYGKNIGYELDLKYWVNIGRQADLGLALAYVWAGDAWKIKDDEDPKNAALTQAYLSFKF